MKKLILSLPLLFSFSLAHAQLHTCPYLQNPSPDGMSILWFSKDANPGTLKFWRENESVQEVVSKPVLASALLYSEYEVRKYFSGKQPSLPYRHHVRLTDLQPDGLYHYRVEQGKDVLQATFRTSPLSNRKIRFIVYADSETEPESTGIARLWTDPSGINTDRRYPIDQTRGYAQNLSVMFRSRPDFILIAGDLVETGGEQRDWDEFWKHNCNPESSRSLASHIPILPALGNHEYYYGEPHGYSTLGSKMSIAKYLTYFEVPNNQTQDTKDQGHYYRFDYGPASFIVLDSFHNQLYPYGPDFRPGSQQYEWLQKELKDAQANSEFTFVIFHHAPYTSGVHGLSLGKDAEREDTLSSRELQVLTPLFLSYGVDAVFGGHDEMYERSEISGFEVMNKQKLPHTIHFYDIGIGGDGLRGPHRHVHNPYRKFLAHIDSPEKWRGTKLLKGGKHYGHLQIDIHPKQDGYWKAILTPVYVLPRPKQKRFIYTDIVTIQK